MELKLSSLLKRLLTGGLVVAATAFGSGAMAAPTKSLILGDWYGADATLDSVRTDLIGSDARFDQANSASLNLTHGLPTLGYLSSFDSVLVFTDSISVSLTDLSDLLGNYVNLGGHRVVLSTFWGQEAGGAGGIINGTGYNPLTNWTTDAYNSSSLGFNSGDWLMQGVNTLSASVYRGDYLPGLDAGATLSASWADGRPLAAYNFGATVVGITLNPNVVGLSHASGDYARLFANALAMDNQIAPIPEPETYAMMLAGLGMLGFMARRRKLKAAA